MSDQLFFEDTFATVTIGKQRHFTVEFSKTFSKVISQIINECFENTKFRRKLGQKGEIKKKSIYYWLFLGTYSFSELRNTVIFTFST